MAADKSSDDTSSDSDLVRVISAFVIVTLGLAIFAILEYVLPVKDGWKASEVTSLVGTLTTFLGTAIGAFLGVQVGAAGKAKSDNLAKAALGELTAEKAAEVLQRTK